MIQTRGLTKTFDDFTAVAALDLAVEPGEAYALLGPLGCGNSCVIKMLATLIPPTRGKATIAGEDVRKNPDGVRKVVGYMPDVMGAYGDMRVEECLRLFAIGHGLAAETFHKRVPELLAAVALEEVAAEFVEDLTHDHRQRLGLARALLHDPQVLLLDKPVTGLDLTERERFFAIIQRLRRREGAPPLTVLMSTNLLSDALSCCDRIGVMLHSRLMAEGPCDEIARKVAPHRVFEVRVDDRAAEAAAALRQRESVRHADAHGGFLIFTLLSREQPQAVIGELKSAGYPVAEWREHEIDFESLVTPAE